LKASTLLEISVVTTPGKPEREAITDNAAGRMRTRVLKLRRAPDLINNPLEINADRRVDHSLSNELIEEFEVCDLAANTRDN